MAKFELSAEDDAKNGQHTMEIIVFFDDDPNFGPKLLSSYHAYTGRAMNVSPQNWSQ